MLTAAIGTPCIIIEKFLRLIYAPSSKIYKIFYDFSVCLLEISESNVIIISPLGNLLVAIVLSISRYSLMEEVKEKPLRWRCADIYTY